MGQPPSDDRVNHPIQREELNISEQYWRLIRNIYREEEGGYVRVVEIIPTFGDRRVVERRGGPTSWHN